MRYKKRKRLLSRKLRGRGGYSFAEGMIALLIVLLVTNAMVAGVEFAMREYHRSMILSESRVLRSTLVDIITDELSDTSGVNTQRTPIHFFSRDFAREGQVEAGSGKGVCFISMEPGQSTEAADGFGIICIGYRKNSGEVDGTPVPVLSEAAYSSYGLKARVDVDCDMDQNLFHVTLTIRPPFGEDMVTAFDVLCLNKLKEDDPDL